MKIGIIVTASNNSGGIFQYTLSVIKALYGMPIDCTFTIFVPPGRNLDLSSFNKCGWSVDTLDVSIFTSSAEIQQQICADNVELANSGFNTRARDYFEQRNIWLLIFPAPWNMSFECGIPYVMAIHDLQHRLQPEFPEVSANGEWRAREYLFRNGAKFAEVILVDSDVGKEDVLNFYGDVIEADRIAVLPFSPSVLPDASITSSEAEIILASYQIPAKYFFYPAQFWFHKNHARIVEALAMLREQHNISPHLVLVGSHEGPPHERRLDVINNVIDLSQQHAVAEQIHYLGYVPDAHMQVLYRHALALVMPTFFGPTNIPILEAWAFGCPVITSDIRGVREQAGDAALLVDPTDSASIAKGLLKIWSGDHLRTDLQSKGFQRLKSFDFSNFSRTLQSCMAGLLKNKVQLDHSDQSTAKDLATFYPQAAKRPLAFIPFAVADEFRVHSPEEIAGFKAASGIDRPYFLLVGRREPHKNHALFFQAFAILPDRERYAIVMAGGGNALEPELRELAGPAAGYAGFFSDQDMSLAYSGAIALVYPSLYEEFALPILEAMRSGCPVITCQNSSLAELAGSAALYVGEQDIEGMTEALLAVQQPDVRAYLVKRGMERARQFSWQKSSARLAQAIRGGGCAND